MNDKERATPEPEQSYDRRRGPRRAGGGALDGDDRRRYERRKTLGVTGLLEDVLSTHVETEPGADGAD